eukprot:c47275_g1_i1 orf=71-289(+)
MKWSSSLSHTKNAALPLRVGLALTAKRSILSHLKLVLCGHSCCCWCSVSKLEQEDHDRLDRGGTDVGSDYQR